MTARDSESILMETEVVNPPSLGFTHRRTNKLGPRIFSGQRGYVLTKSWGLFYLLI